MAFVQQTATSPDSLLQVIRDFAVASGWTILADLVSDPSIDGTVPADGLRLSMESPSGNTFANFRSANGKQIFAKQYSTTGTGIGLSCSMDFTANPPSGKWYDQPGAITDTAGNIIGVGIPVPNLTTSNMNVYLNHITDPAEMLVISVEVLPNVYQHIVVGELQKVGSWTGGTIFSGSRNSYYMFSTAITNPSTVEAESNHILAQCSYSSTFLRIDADSAPLRNPGVRWANAGPNSTSLSSCYTGKLIGLPVFNLNSLGQSWTPKIPHYAYLQSQSSADSGRNCNTLNCITVNLPLAVYIQRDPDALMNFSLVGYVPGIYFISCRNVSPTHTYEISYPHSGQLHQVFPHTRRGGIYGYDGLSVKQ